MLSQTVHLNLPSTLELPCSDDTPVDNEDQNLLPNILLFLLAHLWAERMDWYFGADMAIYHTTGDNPRIPVVPDGFLSLGVERRKGGKSRRSYATWEENDIVPILVLEMVSHAYGGEYDDKLQLYTQLGVLYYIIYNPEFGQRDQHQPFEVYKLEQGRYQLQTGEPFWMPEVGLGLGRSQRSWGGIDQELLLWYDQAGQVYLPPAEQLQQFQTLLTTEQQRVVLERQRADSERQRADSERQRAEVAEQQAAAERQRATAAEQQLDLERQQAEIERQRAAALAAYLRSQNIDPDNLPPMISP